SRAPTAARGGRPLVEVLIRTETFFGVRKEDQQGSRHALYLSITFVGFNWRATMQSSFMVALIVALATAMISGEALAGANGPPGKGPYSVGATLLLELDATRQHQNGSARPVPIIVFYPVDPGNAVGAPTARYPRNPFANQATQVFLSTNFEARGLDPAYSFVTPSAD